MSSRSFRAAARCQAPPIQNNISHKSADKIHHENEDGVKSLVRQTNRKEHRDQQDKDETWESEHQTSRPFPGYIFRRFGTETSAFFKHASSMPNVANGL
jgi:hypothetical protein